MRVLPKGDHSGLALKRGILKGHRRYKVRGEAYPALVEDPGEVHGTVITGLSVEDMNFLDTYEGDEYALKKVQVDVDGFLMDCVVYLWISGRERLILEDWELDRAQMEEFLRDIDTQPARGE